MIVQFFSPIKVSLIFANFFIKNKIQINLTLGNLSRAKEDIEELLTFDDLSDEIRANLMTIKNQFKI